MSDRLGVDLEGLSRLSLQLRSIVEALAGAPDQVSGYDDAVGDGQVRDALHHFQSHWSDGRRHLSDNAKTLATMLDESVRSLRTADQKLTESLRQAR